MPQANQQYEVCRTLPHHQCHQRCASAFGQKKIILFDPMAPKHLWACVVLTGGRHETPSLPMGLLGISKSFESNSYPQGTLGYVHFPRGAACQRNGLLSECVQCVLRGSAMSSILLSLYRQLAALRKRMSEVCGSPTRAQTLKGLRSHWEAFGQNLLLLACHEIYVANCDHHGSETVMMETRIV